MITATFAAALLLVAAHAAESYDSFGKSSNSVFDAILRNIDPGILDLLVFDILKTEIPELEIPKLPRPSFLDDPDDYYTTRYPTGGLYRGPESNWLGGTVGGSQYGLGQPNFDPNGPMEIEDKSQMLAYENASPESGADDIHGTCGTKHTPV